MMPNAQRFFHTEHLSHSGKAESYHNPRPALVTPVGRCKGLFQLWTLGLDFSGYSFLIFLLSLPRVKLRGEIRFRC